jgi:hypothetical protein
MTTNYHTPHGVGDALTAAVLNGVYSDLDSGITTVSSAVNNAIDGTTAITQLRLGTSALTIAAGAVTVTRSRHTVDTEGGAAADDLDTINGGTDGDMLEISLANAARVVTIRHNVGNIRTVSGGNIVMEANQVVQLRYLGTVWVVLAEGGLLVRNGIGAALTRLRDVTVPNGVVLGASAGAATLGFLPGYEGKNFFAMRAAGAVISSVGAGAMTAANTPVVASDADGAFLAMVTTASSGNAGGVVSTFDLVERQHNPTLVAIVKTPSTITSVRYFVGLTSAALTDADAIAGATEFIGFRWSTVTADVGWRPVTKDSTTQNTGTAIGTVAADTKYKLKFRVDSGAGIVYFSVNDSAEQSLNANLPAAGTNLGVVVRVFTQTAAIRQINLSRVYVEFNG